MINVNDFVALTALSMIYNYHMHTYRCGHATGSEEEYIKRAIQGGLKYIGFSDHMPFMCSDNYESPFRVPVAQAKDYIDDIRRLRKKYENDIDIKIGFEMEYYPDEFNGMLESATEFGAEYLILGQHYLGNELFDCEHTIAATDSLEKLKKYVSCIVFGIKSGVFTYVAHPDIFNFVGEISVYKEEMKKICEASRIYNIPLEINFLGIRYKRNYPNDAFWEIAGTEKSPVVFGFDAHDVESACDTASLDKAKELVKKYNLNYIGLPKLLPLTNASRMKNIF